MQTWNPNSSTVLQGSSILLTFPRHEVITLPLDAVSVNVSVNVSVYLINFTVHLIHIPTYQSNLINKIILRYSSLESFFCACRAGLSVCLVCLCVCLWVWCSAGVNSRTGARARALLQRGRLSEANRHHGGQPQLQTSNLISKPHISHVDLHATLMRVACKSTLHESGL